MNKVFSFSFTLKELWLIMRALGKICTEESITLLKNIKISYEQQVIEHSKNEQSSNNIDV